MNRILFGLLLFSSMIMGCETVIDIELPPHESQLVVNGYFTPDSTWDVRVSSSVSYTDTLFGRAPWVEDATVEIWTDNERVDVLSRVDAGRYRGGTQPDPETEYTIRATAPDLDPIEGVSQVPPGGRIEGVQIGVRDPANSNNSLDEREVEFSVTLQDRPDFDDYYNIRLISVRTRIERSMEITDSSYTSFKSRDLTISEDGIEDWYFTNAYFTDDLFDGRSYDFKLSVQPFFGFLDPNDELKFYVQLLTVSEELYFYEISADLQQGTDQDPFSEPVDVYSNMSSGFGIFAGYHSQVVEVPVDIELLFAD